MSDGLKCNRCFLPMHIIRYDPGGPTEESMESFGGRNPRIVPGRPSALGLCANPKHEGYTLWKTMAPGWKPPEGTPAGRRA